MVDDVKSRVCILYCTTQLKYIYVRYNVGNNNAEMFRSDKAKTCMGSEKIRFTIYQF